MNLDFYYSRSLKTKIIGFMLVIFLLSIWSLAYFAQRVLRQDMQALLGAQQLSTASFIAADVNHALQDRLDALETVAKGVTPALLANPAALQTFLNQRLIFQTLFNSGVMVHRLDGTAMAALPLSAGRIGRNYMDRDDVARYVLKNHLADTKYQILEASNGEDGLRLAQSEQPSVIILYLAMPNMDGFEVLARLKANPATQAIPVIINTSSVLEEADLKALRPEALAIISKDTPSREVALTQLGDALQRAISLGPQHAVSATNSPQSNP